MLNISIWIVVALGVVCILLGVSFGIARYRNNGLTLALKRARWQCDYLATENEQLSAELQGTRDTIKARGIEMATLQGEKTVLRLQNEQFAETIVELNEALRESTSHIGNLHLEIGELQAEKVDLHFRIAQLEDEESARRAEEINATQPLVEVAPEPVKRPARKKAGTQQ